MARFSAVKLYSLLVFIIWAPLASGEQPWLTSDDQEQLVFEALLQEERPYQYGARRPTSVDCSSLMQKIWSSLGIQLPRTSQEQSLDQRFETIPLNTDELIEGDLIFFKLPRRRGISHVGIAIGNGEMVHASLRSRKVRRTKLALNTGIGRYAVLARRYRSFLDMDHFLPRFYSPLEK